MNTKLLFSVNDISEIIGCSKSHAYKVIERLNEELIAENYLVVRGKISKDYFYKRYNLQ